MFGIKSRPLEPILTDEERAKVKILLTEMPDAVFDEFVRTLRVNDRRMLYRDYRQLLRQVLKDNKAANTLTLMEAIAYPF